MFDLQRRLEDYISTLLVFSFNNYRYDLNLIKPYLIPVLITEKILEPRVVKKTIQIISLKFGNVHFLDILNFIGSATTFFLKVCETSETMKISTAPPTGTENYSYLEKIWCSENMSTFKYYLEWYNNKDVVPTLEALQKRMKFYHEREIDMLKLGYNLPILASIYLHSATTAKFSHSLTTIKVLWRKSELIWWEVLPLFYTREAVVGETKIRFTDTLCRTIIGIDSSQLYPFSMCQEMPTDL